MSNIPRANQNVDFDLGGSKFPDYFTAGTHTGGRWFAMMADANGCTIASVTVETTEGPVVKPLNLPLAGGQSFPFYGSVVTAITVASGGVLMFSR